MPLWSIGARASPRLPAMYFYASLCSYKSMNAISHVTCAQDFFAYTVIKFSLFFILLLWRGRSIHAAYCPTHRLCLAFLVFWRKMSRIYTLLLHTSNRMYHIAYRLLPSPVTLNVVRLLQDLSNALRRTFVRHFARFNWHGASRGLSAIAELLVGLGIGVADPPEWWTQIILPIVAFLFFLRTDSTDSPDCL